MDALLPYNVKVSTNAKESHLRESLLIPNGCRGEVRNSARAVYTKFRRVTLGQVVEKTQCSRRFTVVGPSQVARRASLDVALARASSENSNPTREQGPE